MSAWALMSLRDLVSVCIPAGAVLALKTLYAVPIALTYGCIISSDYGVIVSVDNEISFYSPLSLLLPWICRCTRGQILVVYKRLLCSILDRLCVWTPCHRYMIVYHPPHTRTIQTKNPRILKSLNVDVPKILKMKAQNLRFRFEDSRNPRILGVDLGWNFFERRHFEDFPCVWDVCQLRHDHRCGLESASVSEGCCHISLWYPCGLWCCIVDWIESF